MDLLFVYGTLRSEFNNRYAKMLREKSAFAGRSTVPGSIFRIAHYPGYRTEPAGVVHGEMYRLKEPVATFGILDAYEGKDFERVAIGSCWIYRYRSQPDESARIISGDFCRP